MIVGQLTYLLCPGTELLQLHREEQISVMPVLCNQKTLKISHDSWSISAIREHDTYSSLGRRLLHPTVHVEWQPNMYRPKSTSVRYVSVALKLAKGCPVQSLVWLTEKLTFFLDTPLLKTRLHPLSPPNTITWLLLADYWAIRLPTQIRAGQTWVPRTFTRFNAATPPPAGGISLGLCPWEIPWSSPASPRKTPSFPPQ